MLNNKQYNRRQKWPLAALLAAAAAQPAARADYPAVVQGDHPKAYYRLNDSTNRTTTHVNLGTLGAAGNAVDDQLFYKGGSLPTGTVHSFPGAIVGDADRSEFFDYTTRTEIPFNSAFNTPNTQPFTVEAWFYPASDQTGTGQAPINNRYTEGSNRQGWTFFQRRPDATYNPGDSGLGWNFRMYNGVGGNTPLDIQSLVPYSVGKWQYVVVVYDPIDATDATLSIYIDGVLANSLPYAGTDPAYAPCTGDHDSSEATAGQPNLSIGCYNNANTGLNPYFGAVDEFAWYSRKLSEVEILTHYQNATNANRATPYSTLIRSANPVVYLRLDEVAPGPDVAVNLGDTRSASIGVNTSDVRHPSTSAIVSEAGDGAASYHLRNGNSTTDIPFVANNNPAAGVPFTFETWLKPTNDRQNPGAAPVNNRYVSSGNRTGWVIFQRAPDATYSGTSGYSGVGWNFRMYSGYGSGGQDVTTGVDYNMNEWQHFVVTWEPQNDHGDAALDSGAGAPNGNDRFDGILTAYVNGVVASVNSFALYAANVNPTEDGSAPSDLAVGSYNAASGIGANPYEGDVDELAFYNNVVLTPDQILAHYVAGTNSIGGVDYANLVLTSGFTGPERVGLPATYLRFNEVAQAPVANSGTAGAAANGEALLTADTVAGPQVPAYPGFDSLNAALPLNGLNQWASLNNPAALNISGKISLEAWVLPGAAQGTTARIISHGPETATTYPGQGLVNAVATNSEVFLRLDNSGATYSVGSEQYDDTTGITTTNAASATVPSGDLGGTAWVHLVGTYDGAKWNLYRNGALIATQASATGALAVSDADWAIGATGEGWADNFAGTVDEVAIYDYALTAAQVGSHYGAGNSKPKLSITGTGGSVTITWPYGTLYQATSVNGPWTAVPGNPTSPYTTTATGAAKFYRF